MQQIFPFPFNAQHSSQFLKRMWRREDTENFNETKSSSPDFDIKFRIRYKHFWVSPWETGRNSMHLMRVDLPSFKDFSFDPCLLNQTHESYSLFYRILTQLNIEPDIRDSWVQKIYSFAYNMANSVPKNTTGCNKLVMLVDILFFTVYYCDERMEITEGMRDSIEEYQRRGNRMPASKSSIETLEKAILDDRDFAEKCMVCLEEFPMESIVTRMPCSHLFHGSCIVMWLEKSSACPLCRFVLI